ncbi:hypothetical protein [Streptomyces nanshensis]|uniref:Uncharacterized protein n=1 Tax=Streptomyces nanshensis TaxID=518642 RepID=A0A1E7LAN4_9ACTN|nr:hypothetical protein [Streptomyces nanshensis]OEV13208.1 hypothetical protein AN218_04640 [Streptomyces nanshensis]
MTGYGFGAFVVGPAGGVDVIAGRSSKSGGPTTYRLEWGGRDTWYGEDELRPATYADFRAVSLGADAEAVAASRARAVAEGRLGRSRGAGAHVFTPCCEAGHYLSELHGSVICRGCGWHYLVRHFPAATFWVSLGFGKTPRRRKARRWA